MAGSQCHIPFFICKMTLKTHFLFRKLIWSIIQHSEKHFLCGRNFIWTLVTNYVNIDHVSAILEVIIVIYWKLTVFFAYVTFDASVRRFVVKKRIISHRETHVVIYYLGFVYLVNDVHVSLWQHSESEQSVNLGFSVVCLKTWKKSWLEKCASHLWLDWNGWAH